MNYTEYHKMRMKDILDHLKEYTRFRRPKGLEKEYLNMKAILGKKAAREYFRGLEPQE